MQPTPLRDAPLAVGYVYRGDLGIAGREAFRAEGSDVPRGGNASRWPKYHVYVCRTDSRELRRHIAFRDALRSSPSLVARYAALKRALAHDSGDSFLPTIGETDLV